MSREIKFRGKDKKPRTRNMESSSRIIKFRAWDKNKNIMKELLPIHWYEHSREPYMLMQYTGLKDKNGKEIYEGDIVKDPTYSKGHQTKEVVWSDEGAFSLLSTVNGAGYNSLQEQIKENGVEIIGNIYENKEIIKNGD